jgi:D-alanyl-D-alanine carboxypeptidase
MKKIITFLVMLVLIPINVNGFDSVGQCTILMDQDSGRVLYAKDVHTIRSVASISKIMTAVVAIESNKLDDEVEMGEEILKAYGSAIYIKVGEKMSLRNLLYGLMLRSGNDAAIAIANYVSGSVEDFVTQMNRKAKEIGMKNTTFNNPSGLDNEKANYSTAYDMAILTSYAMKSAIYKEIVSTKSHTVKTNMNTYVWTNKNKLLNMYKYTTGGKTGFTEVAKRTLVSTATKDNLNLVVVTLNNGNDFNEHVSLYEEAYQAYSRYDILKKGIINIYDENYYKDHELYVKNNFSYPLSSYEKDTILLKFEIEKKRFFSNDEKVGIVKVMIGEKKVHEEIIYVKEKKTTEKKGIFKRFFDWIKNLW